jgi:hypothetical protein
MHVVWDSKIVDAPIYKFVSPASENSVWKLQRVVVTAASTSSTVEFADATNPDEVYGSMVGDVSLSGDAKLYLPAVTTVAPTGKLLAVVQTANGSAFTDPDLTVKLVGTWEQKTTSYAPPVVVTKQIASATVVNGGATLQLQGIPASLAGKTVTATATMTGPGFIPVTRTLKIRIS